MPDEKPGVGVRTSDVQPIALEIHPAKPEQAEILSQIAFDAKAHWGYPEHWMELWRPQLVFSAAYVEQNESWTAEIQGRVVAFYTLLERDGNAWLENLWVSPEWMGKGVGKRLFQHALQLSRQRGFETLQLEADPHAKGFYEKLGMIQVGERSYQMDGQPRFLPLLEIRL